MKGELFMPMILIYLAIMLIVIVVWFNLLKRPVYEGILIAFIILLTITNKWNNVWVYINTGLSTSLIYSMTAFMAMSIILSRTKVIDSCIAIILSLFGRLIGGAGYVSVLASSFMGALSGSGPGNVMATGTITIPAMKKSGFPAELAANIESNASYLGNMIPPSSNIVAALGAYVALYPTSNLSTGEFWIILWGISIWFIIQRLIMVYIFCRYYKVKPIQKEDIPNLKEVLIKGWKGLLLPLIIILPFLLDYLFKDTFFTQRLGSTGAKYLSSSLLLFIAGLSSMYACLISEDKKIISFKKISETFSSEIKTIVPAVSVCLIGYMIGALFNDINAVNELELLIMNLHLSKIGLVVFICLLTCFLGMVIPGSSLVVIFGPVFISTLSTVGVNPILVAAMLPCICGVMCGITPPLGLGMYAGMSLAESDFEKTFKNNLWWVFAQFVMEVLVLLGLLPIIGL